MKFFMIAPYYLYWHYTRGLTELSKNLLNFIVFELHFFSIKELLLTLFSPFQRLKENYGNSIVDFENIASALVVNVIMRVVGFVVRSLILLVGFFAIMGTIFFAPILLILWILLPFVLLIFLVGAVWAYLTYQI